jgi:hypothetical protein
MCQTANPTSASPTCATSGDDWQRGWLIFGNPSCTTGSSPASNTANFIIKIRSPQDPAYTLDSSGVYELLFDGRGLPNTAMDTRLVKSPEGTNFKYARRLCVSMSGRVSVLAYTGTCI